MFESNSFQDQMRVIRWRRDHERLRFGDEIRIIPKWVFYAVGVLFVIAQIVLQILNLGELAAAGIATAISVPVACLIFLIAYINRDAARRGMNTALWTLFVIFVPYLIGLIIYFVMREPLASQCPACGATVNARFNYCPACRFNFRPTCPQCKREVRPGDRYCPFCAHELANAPDSKAAEAPSPL